MTMTHENSAQFDESALTGLDRLLDLLLPGTSTLPAGVKVVDYLSLLGRVFDADPNLVAPVVAYAQRAGNATDGLTLEDIESWGADEVDTVVQALHSAYYMSTEVMRALHYPGQGRYPISAATPEEQVSDDLLAPVRDRGPVYVDVSDFDTNS
jgi:hypothetical protein